MLELIVTSFPVVLRVLYLRWKGIPVTLYNLHYALFAWFVLALVVFFCVFYYHPKSYTGVVPFRTVPVVAETGGDVTEVSVGPNQRVEPGDVLFRIDDARQQAALVVAESRLAEIQAAKASAAAAVEARNAALKRSKAQLERTRLRFEDQKKLQSTGSAAFRKDELERLEAEAASREADVERSEAELASAVAQRDEVLPAQMASAVAAVEQARIEVEKTVVRSRVSGLVEQVSLNVGARASQLALRPAMVIVPDRPEGQPAQIVAGFSQVALSILHVGMPGEAACESSLNSTMTNSVLPVRVARIQQAVATGQITPTGSLLEPRMLAASKGEAVVYFELVYPEHQALLVEGTSCILQTYTTHMTGSLEGSLAAHGIEALGALKAILLRIKVWVALAAGAGLVSGGGGH